MNRPSVLLLLLGGLWFGAAPASAVHKWFADGPSLLSLGAGVAEVFDDRQEFFWEVEYRPAFRFFHLGPWLLFGTGKSGEFYAAGGVLADVELGRGWVFTPGFGAGYYHASRGLDLGFNAEFRTAFELARRFGNGHRLGLCLAHLSNGSLGKLNPGTETLGLTYSFPLDFLFRRAPAAAIPDRME